jgi:hypothetical protein
MSSDNIGGANRTLKRNAAAKTTTSTSVGRDARRTRHTSHAATA